MYRLGYEVPVCKDRLITDQDPCGLSLKHSVYNSDFALGYRRYALDIRQFQICADDELSIHAIIFSRVFLILCSRSLDS